MTNNVKNLRLSKGVSLTQLATKVDAPPAVVRKIETNARLAEVGLAKSICAALGTPIEWVFPGATKALAALEHELAGPTHVSRKTFAKLREVGLEADTRRNTMKVILRGHVDPMFFSFAPHELDRLFSVAQEEDDDASYLSFIVFDSGVLRVAINLRSMVFCHFLWDAAIGKLIRSEEKGMIDEDADPTQSVQVYFECNATPIGLGAEIEDSQDIENENNYVNAMFCLLDSGGLRSHERLHIVDEDGESAFLRAGDISLLTAPLWVLDPDQCGDEEEEGEAS
jgi:DNA-binding XRE family transcriptional regulator